MLVSSNFEWVGIIWLAGLTNTFYGFPLVHGGPNKSIPH
jgi:hypothetical protein